MTTPAVSIVIPTRNGAATLPAVLDAIARQRVSFAFETIAVDSSSTDGTAELLRDRVDRLITIPADGFDHGLTRNLGIEQACGDLVVLIVQDAIPVSDGWLAALTAPLVADSTLAGAFARQIPRQDASAIVRHYHAGYLASSNVARTVSVASRSEMEALDPIAQMDRCTFDNVCSSIRRSVWAGHSFRATPIAEDLEWARDVLIAGHRLAYVPDATVIHSHDRSARYEFERTYTLHRRLYGLFGLRTVPSAAHLARAIASSLVLHLRLQGNARAVALAFAWPLGQYLGARSALRGGTTRRSRRVR